VAWLTVWTAEAMGLREVTSIPSNTFSPRRECPKSRANEIHQVGGVSREPFPIELAAVPAIDEQSQGSPEGTCQ
jgi:hypothetical protein